MSVAAEEFLPARSVTEAVADWLSRRILNGELVPGDPLVEASLARQLGYSRAPVREAILRLAGEGIVDLIPRRSPIVAPFSVKECQDLYSMRILIGGAVFREFFLQASKTALRVLGDYVGRLEETYNRNDVTAFREALQEFHRSVCQGTPNRIAGELAMSLWLRTGRYRLLVAHMEGSRKRSLREHQDIYRAGLRGDADQVEKLWKAALGESMKEIVSRLSKE